MNRIGESFPRTAQTVPYPSAGKQGVATSKLVWRRIAACRETLPGHAIEGALPLDRQRTFRGIGKVLLLNALE
jgi:hypothetical protein